MGRARDNLVYCRELISSLADREREKERKREGAERERNREWERNRWKKRALCSENVFVLDMIPERAWDFTLLIMLLDSSQYIWYSGELCFLSFRQRLRITCIAHCYISCEHYATKHKWLLLWKVWTFALTQGEGEAIPAEKMIPKYHVKLCWRLHMPSSWIPLTQVSITEDYLCGHKWPNNAMYISP